MHLIHHILPLICLLFLQVLSQDEAVGDKYLLGVGRADVTGPVVEIGMMGYADLAQKGSGLRQRIHSRAFIVADVNSPGTGSCT